VHRSDVSVHRFDTKHSAHIAHQKTKSQFAVPAFAALCLYNALATDTVPCPKQGTQKQSETQKSCSSRRCVCTSFELNTVACAAHMTQKKSKLWSSRGNDAKRVHVIPLELCVLHALALPTANLQDESPF